MTMKEIASYANRYNPSAFLAKVKENSRQMGATLTYKAYLLYYMMTDKEIPVGAKAVIAGALAYLVLPLDLIPDFLPVGYADDFAGLTLDQERGRAPQAMSAPVAEEDREDRKSNDNHEKRT